MFTHVLYGISGAFLWSFLFFVYVRSFGKQKPSDAGDHLVFMVCGAIFTAFCSTFYDNPLYVIGLPVAATAGIIALAVMINKAL